MVRYILEYISSVVLDCYLVIDHHQQNQEKVPLMSLIEALGQYLVHTDDTIRAKCMKIQLESIACIFISSV